MIVHRAGRATVADVERAALAGLGKLSLEGKRGRNTAARAAGGGHGPGRRCRGRGWVFCHVEIRQWAEGEAESKERGRTRRGSHAAWCDDTRWGAMSRPCANCVGCAGRSTMRTVRRAIRDHARGRVEAGRRTRTSQSSG